MGEEVRRIADNPSLLVFYTNTDEEDYPIFLTPEREVYTKKRPSKIVATFHVLSVTKKDGGIEHELFREAMEAIKEVSKEEPSAEFFLVHYEVYGGDYESRVGEAYGEAIRLSSCETPFSGYKWDGRKAWAIGYDWKKRISAKHPVLTPYMYLKGESGKKDRAWVKLYIKLPKSTPELDRIFQLVVGSAPVPVATPLGDLERHIREIEIAIEERKREISTLEQQLQQLQLKLQLERMKAAVI